jgi:hypothetical protein
MQKMQHGNRASKSTRKSIPKFREFTLAKHYLFTFKIQNYILGPLEMIDGVLV